MKRNYVDKFIIVVSNMTYSGLHKNFTFESFGKNIQPYMDKIDIVYFNNICNKKQYSIFNSIWCHEASQRDYAKTYIEENYNPTENDLLIVVDIDEILTREGINYIKKNPPNDFCFIKGSLYFPYYYHKIIDWDKSLVIRYNKNMKTLNTLRTMKITKYNTLKYEFNPSRPLVTHCTYCFKNIEEFKNKLKSYSHQEFNKPPFTTNNWIFKSFYCREKINSPPEGYDEPYEGWKHLIPDDERLKYLIDPSFKFPLNQTTFTEIELGTMCNKKFNRTPFELSAKYKY
jgi:beta-1,4-mannosyl-glycoprotein beta-1,4-N-acetylglucosaminyltransferase